MQTLGSPTWLDEMFSLASYYDATSFIDVIYRAREYLRRHPADVPSYPLIVIDEYQDFTLLETELIQELGTKNRLLVAGDDDQSLYGFRHASPSSSAVWRAAASTTSSTCHSVPAAQTSS